MGRPFPRLKRNDFMGSELNAKDIKHLRLIKQTPFSSVTLAQLLRRKEGVPELVAAKASFLSHSSSSTTFESAIQEADFLRFFSSPERQHEGLIGFYGTAVTESEGQPVLVQCLEYCSGGDLLTALLAGRLEQGRAREIFRSLVATVAHLHKHGVVHLDLKPENILLSAPLRPASPSPPSPPSSPSSEGRRSYASAAAAGEAERKHHQQQQRSQHLSSHASSPVTVPSSPPLRVKLCDFGMARWWSRAADPESEQGTTRKDGDGEEGKLRRPRMVAEGRLGTTGYMAPEVWECQPFDPFSADVYSLGVILFVLLTGCPPYTFPDAAIDPNFARLVAPSDDLSASPARRTSSRGSAANNVAALLSAWKMEGVVSPAAADLLARLICREEQGRLSLAQLQEHPWMHEHEYSADSSSNGGASSAEEQALAAIALLPPPAPVCATPSSCSVEAAAAAGREGGEGSSVRLRERSLSPRQRNENVARAAA